MPVTVPDLVPVPEIGDAIDRDAVLDAARGLGMPVDEMGACAQAPLFHGEGDVLTHTLCVLDALVTDPDWMELDEGARAELFLTALLHDIAKPATTRIEDGVPRQPGHGHRGEKMARAVLWRAGLPFGPRERIAQAIRYHLHPFYLLERSNPVALVTQIAESVSPRHLAILARADARGRICADQDRLIDAIDLFSEFADEQGVSTGAYPFASPYARFTYFASQSRENPRIDRDYDPYREDAVTMHVTSGLPASGKDTYVANLGLPIVSLDALRALHGLSHTGPQGAVVAKAREAARVHLRAKQPFVWNATCISRMIRGQAIELGAMYGAQVDCWAFEAPEAVLRTRNASRAHPVPTPFLDRMIARWEPPSTAECAELTVLTTG